MKSIRLKILLVVSTIVLVGLAAYVYLAINTFKKDKGSAHRHPRKL